MHPDSLAALRLDDTYVRIMCEVLDEHGIDSRTVLAEAGLPRKLPEQGGTTSAEESIAFRRAFVAATNKRRELWSITAGRLVLHTTHPYAAATRTARDIDTVVRLLGQGELYLALMTIHPLRNECNELVGIEFDFSAAPPDLREYEEVTAITAHIRGWDSLWTDLLPYRFMELPVALDLRDINRERHPNVVRASGRPRLHWYPEVSTRLLPGANQFLHRRHVAALQEQIAQLRGSTSVRDRILRRLRTAGGASLSLTQAARELGMSTRTLQRLLANDGLTFRSLQDTVKRDQAIEALRTATPISQIALDLGYASPSNFSDAFRQWFGQSPSSYRSNTAQRSHSPHAHFAASESAPSTSESAPHPIGRHRRHFTEGRRAPQPRATHDRAHSPVDRMGTGG